MLYSRRREIRGVRSKHIISPLVIHFDDYLLEYRWFSLDSKIFSCRKSKSFKFKMLRIKPIGNVCFGLKWKFLGFVFHRECKDLFSYCSQYENVLPPHGRGSDVTPGSRERRDVVVGRGGHNAISVQHFWFACL